ncbi:protein-cysteine N-palmitoyltransferase HHAT-like [Mercenaria mercenaria]|uniref:protein-cysteine N-palmitoyltransferase HHAT-like n=1 Tax=Mercenaria mercenaria TaxID=6596 RepID=UPI00234EC778|nr:protein-cysteine N-palmitoyltransferase HHAT-like [Mercenaria mercenaria]
MSMMRTNKEMGSKKKSIDRFASPLSLVERWIYFVGAVWTVSYLSFCVYRDSIKYFGVLNLHDFGKGWFWLVRDQDISNLEWSFWYAMFWRIWPWYAGHVALGKIMEWNSPANRKYIFLIFALMCICQLAGWRFVILFLLHCSVMYVTSLCSSTVLVWIVSLSALSTLNFEPFLTLMKSLVEEDKKETWYNFLVTTLALANIKVTSFCLEKCWHNINGKVTKGNQSKELNTGTSHQLEAGKQSTQGRESVGYSFIDLLCYVFYLPLFFTGPILTFDLFKDQMNAPVPQNTRGHLKLQSLHLLRFCFWAMFHEFLLHFLYFNALQNNTMVLKSVSRFTLMGIGYLHGQFFMVRYLVMFGLPGTIANFDYLNPPDGPKCISYIYLYSDMWKFFDRGLYSFLKRYIYIPCGGSQTGIRRQTIGSLLCFLYIFYWHGTEYDILLWVLLNFISVFFEKIGLAICSISIVKHIETDILSAAMVQRIHAFFSVPIFIMSCFSMFGFFGGRQVLYIFCKRLITEGTAETIAVKVVINYCCIQNAIEVNRWILRRKKLKQS